MYTYFRSRGKSSFYTRTSPTLLQQSASTWYIACNINILILEVQKKDQKVSEKVAHLLKGYPHNDNLFTSESESNCTY